MRVKVIKDFTDKNSKILHKAPKEIEITKERYEEINSTSLGVFVEEIVEKPVEKVVEKPKRKTTAKK